MGLLDYKNFLLEAEKVTDIARISEEDVKDVVQSLQGLISRFELIAPEGKSKIYAIRLMVTDRVSQRAEIKSAIQALGYTIEEKTIKSLSNTTPVMEFTTEGGNIIRVVLKNLKADTTFASTVTELIPCLLWEISYSGGGDASSIITAIYDYYGADLSGLDRSSVFVNSKDASSGKTAIDKLDQAVENNETIILNKLGVAYSVYNWCTQHNGTSDFFTSIETLMWAYRAKPAGVDPKSTADIVVFSKGEPSYGISMKAPSGAGEKIRLASTTIYEMLKNSTLSSSAADQYLSELKTNAWNTIYAPIVEQQLGSDAYAEWVKQHGNIELDYWDVSASHKPKKEVRAIVDEWGKTNSGSIQEKYDALSNIVRQWSVDLINQEPDMWKDTLFDLAGITNSDFPVIVLVGDGNNIHVVDADDKATFKTEVAATSAYRGFSASVNAGDKSRINFNIEGNPKKWDARVWSDRSGISKLSDRFINFRIEPTSK